MRPVAIWRHTADESPGTLADAFDAAGVPWQLHDVWREQQNVFSPGDWSGLVVLGGPMGVHDTAEYPFLSDEIVWLRAAVAAELPVLGICLGAQLLARALGAAVTTSPVREIGWYEVQFTAAAAEDRLWSAAPPHATLFQWHADSFAFAAGAVPLALGSGCPAQAFRYGRNAYGIQFHLEITSGTIDRWLDEPAGCAELARIPEIDPAAIRRDIPRRLPAAQRLAAEVFGQFAALSRATSAVARSNARLPAS